MRTLSLCQASSSPRSLQFRRRKLTTFSHHIIIILGHPAIAGDSTNIVLNFTMLMLLIHTYTPCVHYSPYQANVFSNVIMCLTTSCVSDATLYVRIQSSTKTFVLLYFSSSKNSSPSSSWKYLSYPNVTYPAWYFYQSISA